MTMTPHDRISPTAKFALFFRALAGIRFAKEISIACNAEAAFRKIIGDRAADILWMAPVIEGRDKSTDAVLRRSGCPNILELAAGVSPRGLVWTEDPSVNYLLTDLPEILAENRRIFTQILGGSPRTNLSWLAVNATNEQDFAAVGKYFKNGPIAVINEGLLPYLNREEQEQVARNIHRLLAEHGGVWITSDVIERDRLKAMMGLDPVMLEIMKAISGFTGRNFEQNAFASLEQAERCFSDIGFDVERSSARELVTDLSSLASVNADPAKIDAMLTRMSVWLMKPKE